MPPALGKTALAAPDYPRLERSRLRDRARQAIKTSIVLGEIEAGELYTVGAFAKRLGVSATPVREAIGDLANAGLVEVIPNRGFIVPEVSDRDLDEILDLRLMIEVPAIAQVAGQLTDSDRLTCELLVRAGIVAATAGDLQAFLEADRDFHLSLLSPLKNRRLLEIIGWLRDQARLYGLPALAARGQLLSSANEHADILLAAERGEARRGRELMERHLKHTRGIWAGRDEVLR
jgi:DNA-binding GntR family transcriptional regulator